MTFFAFNNLTLLSVVCYLLLLLLLLLWIVLLPALQDQLTRA
jgi:hypothetical protein